MGSIDSFYGNLGKRYNFLNWFRTLDMFTILLKYVNVRMFQPTPWTRFVPTNHCEGEHEVAEDGYGVSHSRPTDQKRMIDSLRHFTTWKRYMTAHIKDGRIDDDSDC